MAKKKKKKSKKEVEDLKLHFIPFERFLQLSEDEKTKTILQNTKEGRIIIIESYLNPEEQADLITNVMSNIDGKFSGVEMISFTRKDFQKQNSFYTVLRNMIIDFLSGRRAGLTIVGPANIVQKIERDPEMIMLSMKR